MNTLLFGQKAKNVKTKANVNEIESAHGSSEAELHEAKKKISELQVQIKQLGIKKASKQESLTPETTGYLQEQIKFLQVQMNKMQLDLDEKEFSIQKILGEKREYIKKYDTLEESHN